VEIVKQRVVQAWFTFARVVGDFLDEAGYRVSLAFRVLFGLVPVEVERRPWNQDAECPVLMDIFDWTQDKLVASVLVWPVLEATPENADEALVERVEQFKGILYKGAADMAISTRVDIDCFLRWDSNRRCWVDDTGYSYDGDRKILQERRK
jgi:hypothetical protein